MKTLRSLRIAAVFLTTLAGRAAAQQPPVFVADLLDDVHQVEDKLVALAQAMPADMYDWRPADGIRSVGEVFKHVASDNYLLTIPLGVAAPEDTGIRIESYPTTVAFEKRTMTKEQTITELKRSFANLESAMTKMDDARADGSVAVFGMTMTQRRLMVMTTTHLHEHLGQSIAYARSNGVVPPWSR